MKVVVEDQASYDKWMAEQAALFVKKPKTQEVPTSVSDSTSTTETVALN